VHEVGRQRRLVVAAEAVAIPLGRQPPVLRPLDLGREIAGGTEAVCPRQPVADPAQEDGLRGKDPTGVALEVAQQRERGRVERRGAYSVGAEQAQPAGQLPGCLGGERHRNDLLGREGTGGDLERDPARNRGRLAGSRSREDAQGPARRLGCGALLGVEAGEDPLGVQEAHRNGAAGRPP
jgi:hypothetical protein